jgi:hypothetical protein
LIFLKLKDYASIVELTALRLISLWSLPADHKILGIVHTALFQNTGKVSQISKGMIYMAYYSLIAGLGAVVISGGYAESMRRLGFFR